MLHAEGQSWRATIPGTGEHLVLNALAAIGAGRAMGIPAETAIEALKNYTPSGRRQRVVEHEGVTMVEDCYNASPDSMRAAIATLAQFPCDGRRIFVAADMLELGDIAEESHREIGTLCAAEGIDLLLTWGEWAAYATRAAAWPAAAPGSAPWAKCCAPWPSSGVCLPEASACSLTSSASSYAASS